MKTQVDKRDERNSTLDTNALCLLLLLRKSKQHPRNRLGCCCRFYLPVLTCSGAVSAQEVKPQTHQARLRPIHLRFLTCFPARDDEPFLRNPTPTTFCRFLVQSFTSADTVRTWNAFRIGYSSGATGTGKVKSLVNVINPSLPQKANSITRKEMTMTKFEKQIKKLLSEQRQLLARKSKEGELYGIR